MKKSVVLIFASLFIILLGMGFVLAVENATTTPVCDTSHVGKTYCKDEKTLMTCDEVASCAVGANCSYGYPWIESYCTNGCSNGACKIACYEDSDCPSSTSTAYCKNNYELCSSVTSYVCQNPGTDASKCVSSGGGVGCKNCTNGCKEGACVEGNITPTCSDSDGGNNLYVRGDCSDSRGWKLADGCIANMEGWVKEAYCTSEDKCTLDDYKCPNGCLNGACVKSNETCPSQKCSDGTIAKCELINGICTCSTCPPVQEVKEQVKCLFSNSTQEQKCYTAEQNSRAYCYGTESCVADILGYKGEKITWKSTCGGYAYTTMGGTEEYAKFYCGNVTFCQSTKCDDGTTYDCKVENGQCICPTCPPIVIKPVCGNGICESGEGEICACPAIDVQCAEGKECAVPPCQCSVVCPQDCQKTEPIYANLSEKFKLQIFQQVKIMEKGNPLMKITFKDLMVYKCESGNVSSPSETISTKVAAVTGMIIASGTSASGGGSGGASAPTTSTSSPTATTTTPVEIIKCVNALPTALLNVEMSQANNTMVLSLNLGEKKQVGEFTIYFISYDYASRTGTFLVQRGVSSCPSGCICNENATICPVKECVPGTILCPDGTCSKQCAVVNPEDCKYGCNYEGKCFPMSVRSNGTYCGTDLIMSSQKDKEEKCENNFECTTNVCVDGKCVSSGIIQKFLRWLSGLFVGK